MPELLTCTDLANKLGCTEQTIRNYVRNSKLPKPAIHVGKCIRWTEDQLTEWMTGKAEAVANE